MFNDDERISDVSQIKQSVYQALVIALMQSDGRLVENVKNAGKAGADLSCKPDTLGFSAGKRCSLPLKRKIFKAYVFQKQKPVIYFFQNLRGDFLFGFRKLKILKERDGIFYRKLAERMDVFSADGNGKSFFFKAHSAAASADAVSHQFFKAFFLRIRKALCITALKLAYDARPYTRKVRNAGSVRAVVYKMNRFSRAVHNGRILRFCKLIKRRFQRKALLVGNGFYAAVVPVGICIESLYSAFRDRKVFIRDNQVFIKIHSFAETRTVRACTERIVKGKKPWLQVRNRDSAVRT